jgi:AcrR family transcriptional regulator
MSPVCLQQLPEPIAARRVECSCRAMMKQPQARRAGRTSGGHAPVDMQAKAQPLQERSRQTYEAILSAAAVLLEEVGIDSLSTNLICARANLTPPALYRYFPNKYALLKELGIRLMEVQDKAVFEWIEAGGLFADTLEEAFAKSLDIQTRVNEITRAQPAALWVARAMRAVPMLRQVRIESRERVVDAFYTALRAYYKNTSDAMLRTGVRLSIELTSAAGEMILEEPDAEVADITRELTWMMVLYFTRFS